MARSNTITSLLILLAGMSMLCPRPVSSNPNLTPGVWTNITPSGFHAISFGIVSVALDPQNSSTIWLGTDMEGIWKSTDGGSSWNAHNGNLSAAIGGAGIKIDPKNSRHMYLSSNVRGNYMGIWVSNDGGDTWAIPTSYTWDHDAAISDVDPTDFNHFFVTFHSPWSNGNAGFLETTDGGTSWKSFYPVPGGGAGSQTVHFLWDTSSAHPQGNKDTWLFSSPNGMWRSSNAGQTWTQLVGQSAGHGGAEIFYAKTGVLYSGGNNQMQRSTDNGITWTAIGPRYQDQYYCIIGDGNLLYAQAGNTGSNTIGNQPYICSPETDGLTWTPYNPLGTGAQTFRNGPFRMVFDKANRIIYSVNWNIGAWALKVKDPATTAAPAVSSARAGSVPIKNAIGLTKSGIGIRTVTGSVFDIRGRVSLR